MPKEIKNNGNDKKPPSDLVIFGYVLATSVGLGIGYLLFHRRNFKSNRYPEREQERPKRYYLEEHDEVEDERDFRPIAKQIAGVE